MKIAIIILLIVIVLLLIIVLFLVEQTNSQVFKETRPQEDYIKFYIIDEVHQGHITGTMSFAISKNQNAYLTWQLDQPLGIPKYSPTKTKIRSSIISDVEMGSEPIVTPKDNNTQIDW